MYSFVSSSVLSEVLVKATGLEDRGSSGLDAGQEEVRGATVWAEMASAVEKWTSQACTWNNQQHICSLVSALRRLLKVYTDIDLNWTVCYLLFYTKSIHIVQHCNVDGSTVIWCKPVLFYFSDAGSNLHDFFESDHTQMGFLGHWKYWSQQGAWEWGITFPLVDGIITFHSVKANIQ